MRHLYCLIVIAASALICFQSCHLYGPKSPPIQAPAMHPADSLALQRKQSFDKLLAEASGQIRIILENRLPGQRYTVENRTLHSLVLMPQFYTARMFMPFWFEHPDSLQKAASMVQFIRSTVDHGLQPDDYHLVKIVELFDTLHSDSASLFDALRIAHLDILLTDAYFMIASHLYNGKVDPEALSSQWGIQRNKPELLLDQRLLRFKGNDISHFMKQFYPPHPGYETMVDEAHKISLKQDVPQVRLSGKPSSIKPGEKSKILPSVRRRLEYWSLYEPDSLVDSEIYDENTAHAIKRLQRKFGYQPDGIVGRLTLNALNMSLKERLEHLYVNMERLRWLPDSLEKRFLMVNIADFTLFMLENNDTLLQMKTIVGKDFRETPVFNSKITYLVFSPSWTVPPTIQKADVIPAAARNHNYLKEKNMVVLDARGQQIDPATINWKRDGMRYTIRQAPGPQNALGKVKFMFPNKHNVYLHDTPTRELFARDERTFSSGCIRVEKPYELARLLLDDMPEWTDERIKQAMNSGVERTVVLSTKPGIYIYYLTAWGDASGNIHYRSDIYNRDAEVMEVLKQKKLPMPVLGSD